MSGRHGNIHWDCICYGWYLLLCPLPPIFVTPVADPLPAHMSPQPRLTSFLILASCCCMSLSTARQLPAPPPPRSLLPPLQGRIPTSLPPLPSMRPGGPMQHSLCLTSCLILASCCCIALSTARQMRVTSELAELQGLRPSAAHSCRGREFTKVTQVSPLTSR
jgi:hypothetical protein